MKLDIFLLIKKTLVLSAFMVGFFGVGVAQAEEVISWENSGTDGLLGNLENGVDMYLPLGTPATSFYADSIRVNFNNVNADNNGSVEDYYMFYLLEYEGSGQYAYMTDRITFDYSSFNGGKYDKETNTPDISDGFLIAEPTETPRIANGETVIYFGQSFQFKTNRHYRLFWKRLSNSDGYGYTYTVGEEDLAIGIGNTGMTYEFNSSNYFWQVGTDLGYIPPDPEVALTYPTGSVQPFNNFLVDLTNFETGNYNVGLDYTGDLEQVVHYLSGTATGDQQVIIPVSGGGIMPDTYDFNVYVYTDDPETPLATATGTFTVSPFAFMFQPSDGQEITAINNWGVSVYAYPYDIESSDYYKLEVYTSKTSGGGEYTGYDVAYTKGGIISVYLPQPTDLTVGTYDTYVVLKDKDGGVLSSSDPDISFTVSLYGSGSGSPVIPIDCSGGNFINNTFCEILVYLFVPTNASVYQYTNAFDLIKNKPPFGWFYTVGQAIGTMENATPAVNLEDLRDTFNPIRSAIVPVIYLWGALVAFRRIKNFNL